MDNLNKEIQKQYERMGINSDVLNISDEIINDLSQRFQKIDKIAEYNQLKVVSAFQKNKVAEEHFNTTTGYGYNDIGRDTLEKVYADVFHTEDALVRPQITCGTHALGLALSANLRPGDKLMYISGKPYDTLDEVIGINDNPSSLKSFGIKYKQIELIDDDFDYDSIKKVLESEFIKEIEKQIRRCNFNWYTAFQRICNKTYIICRKNRQCNKIYKRY